MRYRVTELSMTEEADKELVCMGLGGLVVTVETQPMGTIDADDVTQVTADLERLIADIQAVAAGRATVNAEWVPDRTAIAASATCYGTSHLHGLAVLEEVQP